MIITILGYVVLVVVVYAVFALVNAGIKYGTDKYKQDIANSVCEECEIEYQEKLEFYHNNGFKNGYAAGAEDAIASLTVKEPIEPKPKPKPAKKAVKKVTKKVTKKSK